MSTLELSGEILSPGAIRGTLCYIDSGLVGSTVSGRRLMGNPRKEIQRFEKEVQALVAELETVAKILQTESYTDESEIIRTHILMLKDPNFHHRVCELVEKNQLGVELAVEYILKEMIEIIEQSESTTITRNSSDLRDIMLRLKMKLLEADNSIFKEAVQRVNNPIVFLRELLPSSVIEAKQNGVMGIIVENGTSLSHAAILAKSFQIPVLKVVDIPKSDLKTMLDVYVDAVEGKFVVEPAVDIERKDRQHPPVYRQQGKDSLPVSVWLNISTPEQTEGIVWEGLEGIGLYRTELLFMNNKERFPTEDEQCAIYSQLLSHCGKVPVTIRTVDIGGDKSLPYFSLGPQENPYLGLRAHRVFRFHPEIFVTQMKAILRAGYNHDGLRILFPMIETIDDLQFVNTLLETAILFLLEEKKQFVRNFQRGILVEVPSAAWDFENFLPHVDFVSIGTMTYCSTFLQLIETMRTSMLFIGLRIQAP